MYEGLKERLRILRKAIKLREEIQLDINAYEHWNRMNPDKEPLDVSDFTHYAAGLDAMLTEEQSRPIPETGFAPPPRKLRLM